MFRQDLCDYLGPFAAAKSRILDGDDSICQWKLRDFVIDVDMLLTFCENTMRIYEWHMQETNTDYTGEVASERLEEANAAKATAISLSKLTSLAFLYLPLSFVCTMLGMNLSTFG